jgi:hypothetical protein
LTATFTLDEVISDPTVVYLKVMNPDGSIDSYEYYAGHTADIQHPSTGVYYKEITSDQSGEWHYEWRGTGNVVAADEDYYIIEHSKFS